MTAKRFQWVFIKDNELEFQDNGILKRFNNDRLEEFLNELHEENQRLKHTLKKKEELLRDVLKVNDNMVKKIRELENDNAELKEAMKRMMGDLMSR